MEFKKLDPSIKRYNKRKEREQRLYALCQYHEWFAWFPVRVDANTIVWLEHVGRGGVFTYRGLTMKIYRWKYFKINSK